MYCGQKKIDDTENVIIRKITTDTSDNIYITGGFSGTADFLGTIFTNSDDVSDVFLVKLNSLGQTIWAKQFEVNSSFENNETRSNSVVVDAIGNVYITGRFKGTLQAETTTLISNQNPRNPFVIKTNNLGEVIWAKKYESTDVSSGIDITTDTFGKVYIAGMFSGTIDFDGVIFNTTEGNAFVLKTDDSGTIEWIGRYGGTQTSNSAGSNCITINTDGDILLSGTFKFSVNFGGTTFNSVANSADLFLLKLSPNGLGIERNQTKNYSVFPNPVNDILTLNFSDYNNADLYVEVFNMLGQKIKTFKVLNNTENLDLSDLTNGIYLLKINHNKTTQTIKIKKL